MPEPDRDPLELSVSPEEAVAWRASLLAWYTVKSQLPPGARYQWHWLRLPPRDALPGSGRWSATLIIMAQN